MYLFVWPETKVAYRRLFSVNFSVRSRTKRPAPFAAGLTICETVEELRYTASGAELANGATVIGDIRNSLTTPKLYCTDTGDAGTSRPSEVPITRHAVHIVPIFCLLPASSPAVPKPNKPNVDYLFPFVLKSYDLWFVKKVRVFGWFGKLVFHKIDSKIIRNTI